LPYITPNFACRKFMGILKKVFFLVLLLVALSGLKHLLDKYSSNSIAFHYNLITCIQYFILAGVILWSLLQGISYIISKRSFKPKYFWLIYLTLLCCTEGYFYYILRHSEKTSGKFHDLLTEYYMLYEINFSDQKYDSVLSYTLQPNSVYNHSNIEFSNKWYINSAGVRDDEASLKKPDIICLGDSYTQGWGVEQQQSFPELIQQRTGLKVLNTGITSYGTARELLLLNRMDTSNLKYLVIQYCYNDWTENKAFLEHGLYLPVGSRETVERTFKTHKLARTYFPFKYTFTILRMYLRNNFLKKDTSTAVPWENTTSYVAPSADAFLNILSHSNINFSKVQVYVFDTNRYPDYDHHFLDTLEQRMSAAPLTDAFRKSVHLIKFPELNKQEYFYPLDNHLNSKGHEFVADRIIKAIGK